MAEQPDKQQTPQQNAAMNALRHGARRVADEAAMQALRTRTAMANMRLYEAVRSGRPEKVKRVLEANPPPNPDIRIGMGKPSRNPEMPSALYFSVSRGNYEVADLLIDAGADVNPNPPRMGHPILPMMVGHTNERMVPTAIKLIEHGADVNAPLPMSVLSPSFMHSLVLYSQQTSVFKCALRHGGRVDQPNKHGQTVKELLAERAKNPQATAKQAMHWALQLHENAPLPGLETDALSREQLEHPADNGYCALDHWHLWDNYRHVQDALIAKGEQPLRASDLIAPCGGRKGEPKRLEVLLKASPDMVSFLGDADLWQGQSTQTLKQVYEAVPESMRGAIPYYALRAQLAGGQQKGQGAGR
jgi:hypothetical protein